MYPRTHLRFPTPQLVILRGFRAILAVVPALGILAPSLAAATQSRIKDVADFEGVRENLLVGYGLVVGLNGSGDTSTNSAFTKHSLVGTLLVTPMVGADGEVYLVAQGQLAVGGFSAQGSAGSVTKGVPTSGRIPNGGIVERELLFDMSRLSKSEFPCAIPT
jgi:flagellar P-ring protein precursor FlgI